MIFPFKRMCIHKCLHDVQKIWLWININVKSMLVPEAPDRNFIRLTKTNDRKQRGRLLFDRSTLNRSPTTLWYSIRPREVHEELKNHTCMQIYDCILTSFVFPCLMVIFLFMYGQYPPTLCKYTSSYNCYTSLRSCNTVCRNDSIIN